MASQVALEPRRRPHEIAAIGSRWVVDCAQQLLHKSPYYALRRVRCTFHEGVLTLRGTVPSFYLKQMAQTLVRQVPRAEQINNRLEVLLPEDVDS